MQKYASEIFGYPPTNKTKTATKTREKVKCPFYSGFPDGECDPINKKSNLTDDGGDLLLDHQSGACSVIHMHRGLTNTNQVIICPYRFFEKDSSGKSIVLRYIKKKFFHDKDLFFVPEIGLGTYGRADGILCQISKKKENEFDVNDYCHIELQSDSTTATRELILCVKDFFDGKDVTKKNYAYGLNSKSSIKSSSLQMIDKGYLFKHFNKKSIWVMQDSLFHVLCSVYNVEMTDITYSDPVDDENLVFVIVNLEYNKKEDRSELKILGCFSTSPDLLQKAISNKTPIEESIIIGSVMAKIREKKYHKV